MPKRIGGDGAPEVGVSGTAAARFTVWIPGHPLPLARTRAFWDMARGKVRVVNKAEVRAYQDKIGWLTKAVVGGRLIEGPVELWVAVYIKGRRSDLSNHVKMAEDGLNGVAWIDDWQVVEIHSYFAEPQERGEGMEISVIPREDAERP